MEQTEPPRGTSAAARRRMRAIALVVTTIALTAACSGNLGLPDSATEQGDEVTSLWRTFVILAALVAGLIWVLTAMVVVASVKRRRQHGPDRIPEQHQYRTGIEIAYTAAPLVIVSILMALTIVTTNKLTDRSEPDPLDVTVIGFQWQWQAKYPDRNVTLAGVPEVLPELWVPVGRPVRFTLQSPDVIHAFWVPEFLDKRDVIPGAENTVEVNVKAPGQWIGRCAEYCGLYHWQMKFAVCAVPADQFDAWLDRQAAKEQPVKAGPATPGVDAATGNPTPGGEERCPSPPSTSVSPSPGGSPGTAGPGPATQTEIER